MKCRIVTHQQRKRKGKERRKGPEEREGGSTHPEAKLPYWTHKPSIPIPIYKLHLRRTLQLFEALFFLVLLQLCFWF